MNKGKSLSEKVARQVIVGETVIAAVGRGRPVEVHTVSALVHLTILHARRAQAVATILRRANAQLTRTQEPRSSEAPK